MAKETTPTEGEIDITVWKLKAIAKQLREYYTDRIELREQMAGDVERAAKMLWRVRLQPTGVTALIERCKSLANKNVLRNEINSTLYAQETIDTLREAATNLTKLSAPKLALTDDQIIAIRDEHLTSQGGVFDCIAFARAILNVGG